MHMTERYSVEYARDILTHGTVAGCITPIPTRLVQGSLRVRTHNHDATLSTSEVAPFKGTSERRPGLD